MADIKRVVIPVDFTSTLDNVVSYATSIADQFGAKAMFLHVVTDFRGYEMMLVHPSFTEMANDLKVKCEAKMANLVKDHQGLKGGVSGNVRIGDIAEEIIAFAGETNADMIIIGTRSTKGLEKILMGSTAEKVVKKAPCPVLTFNPFT